MPNIYYEMFIFALMKIIAVFLADCLETHRQARSVRSVNTKCPTGRDLLLSLDCWLGPAKLLVLFIYLNLFRERCVYAFNMFF